MKFPLDHPNSSKNPRFISLSEYPDVMGDSGGGVGLTPTMRSLVGVLKLFPHSGDKVDGYLMTPSPILTFIIVSVHNTLRKYI